MQAERSSRRLERRLKAIIDAGPVPLVVIDSDGKIELWNPAAERMSGLAAADVIGRHPESVLPDLAALAPLVAAGLAHGPVHDLPLEWRGSDGTLFELSGHFALIDDPEGGVDSVVGAVVDIGPIRRSERRIARLNRIYAVLGEIDGAIFTIHERDLLLAEACRIAVQRGGFAFAWVGITDEAGDVAVVARHGPDAGLLEEGRIEYEIRRVVRPGACSHSDSL